MFSCIYSAGVRGIGGYLVKVETDISQGMPLFEMVGYLGSEVREASQRVRTALKNAGFDLPLARITVNLAPADIRKQGTGYDLPVALSILTCMQIIPGEALDGVLVVGELMLSGAITATKGILPVIIEAKKSGIKKCIIPEENKNEGVLVDGVEVICVNSILEVVEHLQGINVIKPVESNLKDELCKPIHYDNDFKNVKGQALARRGIEIGAAGLHNILMSGPPGAGKTMLARTIPSILPPMSEDECLEVTSIYSVKGNMKNERKLVTERPFVAVHHTATEPSMIGGGVIPRPGAVSMADKGILFLDELPEFSRRTLESLRQPLEDRFVTVTRNNDVCSFPSDFMLVAAMNPCPCGYYPDRRKCRCTDAAREKYMSKISGPLMDRIDICIQASKVLPLELNSAEIAESSEAIRKRVIKAHDIQKDRFRGRNISFNSQMNNQDIDKYCGLEPCGNDFIKSLVEKYDISARTYYRILKISRTIADLAGEETISIEHLKEAVRFKIGGLDGR